MKVATLLLLVLLVAGCQEEKAPPVPTEPRVHMFDGYGKVMWDKTLRTLCGHHIYPHAHSLATSDPDSVTCPTCKGLLKFEER